MGDAKNAVKNGAGNRARTDDIQLGKSDVDPNSAGVSRDDSGKALNSAPVGTAQNHGTRTKSGHGSDERGCFSCRHLSQGCESWEMPDIGWFECAKLPQVENLRGWPWKITKCARWTARSAGGGEDG